MRHRLKITEMFSTFACFNNDSDAKWITDKKLHRSIENCLKQSLSPDSEQFWSFYWYKIWLSKADDLAFMHLSAYLQEPCYWAAKSIMNKFSSTKYELVDFFQMGIAEVKKICSGFKPERNSNLKAYAVMAFPSLLKDILRRNKDADICTNYALLRKITKKQFVEALGNAGLTSEEIACYKLVWKCFRVLYVPTQGSGIQKLPEPSKALWSEITNLYNRERLSQLVPPGNELSPETVEKHLTKAAVWLRSYLYPAVNSLNIHNSDNDSPGELSLPELTSESLMTELIAKEDIQERQNQRQQIHDFLLFSLEKLAPEMREVLYLYYQKNLTQQEIALQLGKKQVWVSRKLSKSRETLLLELTKWEQVSQQSPQDVNVSPNPNELKDRSVALEQWLTARSWS
jgi:RNA polymerase sigma factor (sigma-70 family)